MGYDEVGLVLEFRRDRAFQRRPKLGRCKQDVMPMFTNRGELKKTFAIVLLVIREADSVHQDLGRKIVDVSGSHDGQ